MAEKSVFVQNFLALMEQLLLESKEEKEVEDSLDAKQGSYHLSCLINGFYRLYFVSSPSKNAKKRTIDLFESVFASMKNKQI